MYCTKCGAEMQDDAVFCQKCGTKVSASEQTSTETTQQEVAKKTQKQPDVQKDSILKKVWSICTHGTTNPGNEKNQKGKKVKFG